MWSEDLYKIKVEEFFDIEVITDYSLDAIQRACDHF